MIDDGDYKPSFAGTSERAVTSVFLTAWVIIAFLPGGLALAIRACVLYMFPLVVI